MRMLFAKYGAALAAIVAVVFASTNSAVIFHKPEIPQELK